MIREIIGGSARVLTSSGFHSKKYIGETGYAIHSLGKANKKFWVLRFPSILPKIEEGLFDEHEIEWAN